MVLTVKSVSNFLLSEIRTGTENSSSKGSPPLHSITWPSDAVQRTAQSERLSASQDRGDGKEGE